MDETGGHVRQRKTDREMGEAGKHWKGRQVGDGWVRKRREGKG